MYIIALASILNIYQITNSATHVIAYQANHFRSLQIVLEAIIHVLHYYITYQLTKRAL